MGAPASPVDICNLALDECQERANIVSIETPENPNEIILARHYDNVRRKLLREYIWNFSRAEATLARTGDGGFDYTDKYLEPNNCLRVIRIGDKHCPITDFDWRDGAICVNNQGSNALKVVYSVDVTDVTRFDDLFVTLFSLELAWRVAPKVTSDKALEEQILKKLTLELPKAISVNSQQKKPTRKDGSSLIDARLNSNNPTFTPDGRYWR